MEDPDKGLENMVDENNSEGGPNANNLELSGDERESMLELQARKYDSIWKGF